MNLLFLRIAQPSFWLKTLARSLAIFAGSWAVIAQAQINPLETLTPDSSTTTRTIKTTERKFPVETLYSLLVAEIAGSRQQYQVALTHYAQQARQTRDPQVAQRATMIARYLNANDTALDMSLLWLHATPRDKDALANASLTLMQAGRLQEALDISKRIKAQGGEPLFQNIAANAGTLSPQQRAAILQQYKNLLLQYKNDEQLLVGIGLLLQQQQLFDDAMSFASKALKLYPGSIPAAALEANLLHELERDDEAIAKMGAILSLYPDNTSLRSQYAHILTHYDMAQAQQQFTILSQLLPNDAANLLSLGIVAMERKDYRVATKTFERLLDFDQHSSAAHYYLGQIDQAQQNWADAIYNYLQVEAGNDFLPATLSLLNIFIQQDDYISAQQHMVRLRNRFPTQAESLYLLHSQALIKQKHLTKAEQVLNEAVQTHPKSSQLLFARAMLASQRQQFADAERDLKTILEWEPENVIALNSLGYLLTNNKQRHAEARALLSKALELKPNDAAIIDSMGWLHYRSGNYPDALVELRRAYALSPDATISAHLGEVLWVIGSFTEARQVWQKGSLQSPSDDTIAETMKRLKAK